MPGVRPSNTEGIFVVAKFATEEEANSFLQLCDGLAEAKIEYGYARKPKAGTRLGKLVLKAFEIPGRSYHVLDVAAACEEHGYTERSVETYIHQLVKEGLLKNLGPSTYIRPHDTTPAIRPHHDVEAALDGDVARLEQGQTCGCGCGDAG